MIRLGVMATATAISCAAALATTTPAKSPGRPSDRACLVAWNSPANDGNHVRLLAQSPIKGLQLLPGTVGVDKVSNGLPSTQTSSLACLLTFAKRGEIRIITGIWGTAGVSRWSFGRPILTTRPLFSNVRLLSDGRVTKIYRR
jgi:hypothetical protein